ncbi:quinone oxidoreductase-like [Sycon ciliatum]|uniref:quinone oxidoreductase-like n=1 Tax=Sycon ciliatum TaxID=27933 RepID=UPI0031F696F5
MWKVVFSCSLVILALSATLHVSFRAPPVTMSRSALPTVMNAIRVARFGGPEVLKLESNVPMPQPSEGQVLLRVHAAGVNPVETYIRAGTYARKPELPFTPGSDAAGEIADVGAGVNNVKVGDRVFTRSAQGAYAQYALASAGDVQPLSAKLTYEQGAALPVPYLTAYRALFLRGAAKTGETVLIHGGTGGVGTAAIQLALSQGLRVLATGGTDAGLDMLRTLGVHGAFNHRQSGYTEQIHAATDGKGVDLIVENLANVNLDADLRLLALGGRVMVVGNRGRIEVNPRDLMMAEGDVRGVMLFHTTPEEYVTSYAAIQAAVDSGHVRPVIGKRFPLGESPAAHDDIINTSGALGKLVLTVE